VLVETAEERKRQQVAAAVRQADAALITENGQQQHISYVLVPADTSQPLQERTFQPNPTIPGDGLLLHLKQTEFAKKSTQSVDVELLRQHGGSTTLAASAADLPTVSDSTLQQIASEANVETFSLVHPIPSNNFTGINIYLDEGKSVRLKG
jgi:hypothetical protein